MKKMIKKIVKFFKTINKYIQYFVEFVFMIFLFAIARILPFRMASFIFGHVFGNIFVNTAFSRRISGNLRLIYPLMDEHFVKSLTKAIWINTARFIGETPHFFFASFKKFKKRVKIIGEEELAEALSGEKSIITITSHMGNWWMIGKYFKYKKLDTYSIYKATKNPFTRFIVKAGSMKLIEKHGNEMSKIIKVIKQSGKILTVFQDHREANGEKLKLMRRNAMTSTFFAKVAIKYNLPVFYTSCVRDKLSPTKFHIKFIKIFDPEIDQNLDEITLSQKANDIISKDIEENKEQWFWLHKRWKM